MNRPILLDGVQVELLSDLVDGHGVGKVLFVGEDENAAVEQLVFPEAAVELSLGFVCPIAVVAIHHEHKPFAPLVVVTPQRPDFVLPADVPRDEIERSAVPRLHIETDGGYSGDNLASVSPRESIENCGLPRCVQPTHHRPHCRLALLLAHHKGRRNERNERMSERIVRERERVRECVRERERSRECERVCENKRERECVCERERESRKIKINEREKRRRETKGNVDMMTSAFNESMLETQSR